MREKEQYYGCFPYMMCGNSNLDNVPEDYEIEETEKPLRA